jgi:hypothetical protein
MAAGRSRGSSTANALDSAAEVANKATTSSSHGSPADLGYTSSLGVVWFRESTRVEDRRAEKRFEAV